MGLAFSPHLLSAWYGDEEQRQAEVGWAWGGRWASWPASPSAGLVFFSVCFFFVELGENEEEKGFFHSKKNYGVNFY